MQMEYYLGLLVTLIAVAILSFYVGRIHGIHLIRSRLYVWGTKPDHTNRWVRCMHCRECGEATDLESVKETGKMLHRWDCPIGRLGA